MDNNFTDADVKALREFGSFIVEKAKWDLSTKDVMALNRHFAAFNAITKKVEENVLELLKIEKAPDAKEQKAEKKVK